MLAAFGIPTAALAYVLTKHPLLALAILLLYELGVFVVGFIGKVWGKLEDPLAEYIATWLKQWAINLFSRYRRQYYQYLYYQHRDFDVKGLSTLGPHALELDQVFVELSIDTTAPFKATSNPVQLPLDLLEGSHAIWDYLIPSISNHHLTIVGPPGSGKTTLLKHIVLTLIAHQKHPHRSHSPKVSHKVPILLFLRDHAQAINEVQGFSLIDAIHNHLKKWGQSLPPENWFKRQLSRGHCLVMLDGLDEVADPEMRQAVVRWVERQMTGYYSNRFLVTSRPGGYRSNPLNNVTVLEMRPFTSEQVEHFIHRWYLANEIMSKQKDDPGVHIRAQADARELLQKLRTTPALFDLTVNPLLLTMIATVHRYGGELPGNRAALYTEICEVFLGKRQIARGQTLELVPAQIQLVLESLAYHMMIKGMRDIERDEARIVIEEPLRWVNIHMPSETFLQLVENISGLLLERENGIYSYAHQTFQEYLAASYIREKQLTHTLVAKVEEVWWQETIRLYSAMVEATPIITACLQIEPLSANVVELAIDCDKEARKVQPEVRIKLETLLRKGAADPDSDLQFVIANALLARRLRQMIHLWGDTYVDTSLITCTEYQLFLDEQRGWGRDLRPDHWTSDYFPSAQGNAPILGVRQSDAEAFCVWLTQRESGPWRYRLPNAAELEKGEKQDRLPKEYGYWLSGTGGFAWARKNLIGPSHLKNAVELIFTLDNVFARSLVFSRLLDHVHMGSHKNVLNRDDVLDLINDLIQNLNYALALSTNLSSVLNIDFSNNLNQTLAFNLTVAQELAVDLNHINRGNLLTNSLSNARAYVRNTVNTCKLTHIFIPNLDLDHISLLSDKLNRITPLTKIINCIISNITNRVFTSSTNLMDACNLVLTIAYNLVNPMCKYSCQRKGS